MNKFLAFVKKEFRHILRDKRTLLILLGMPVAQVIIFGYAINYDVKNLRTVVLDESRSYDSRELVAKMGATGYFRIIGHVDSMDEMQREIDSARASVGLIIDRDYGKNRHRGLPADAFLIVNASDTTTSSQAMSIMSGISQTMSIQTLARRGDWTYKQLPINVRVRPWYNPDLKTSRFIIPGLIAIILTFTLIQFTAGAIVRERDFQFTLTLLLMRFLFKIEIMGSVLELYVVGFLFMGAVLGLGMLISTIAQTQMQASQMSMFFLLPFVFLSGYVFPIDGMPKVFQWISMAIPAKYFIEVIRGIVLRGASIADLWKPTALLATYTTLIITLAVVRFKKTMA